MKRLLSTLLGLTLLFPAFSYAQQFSQYQLIIAPFGSGVIVSTSTANGGKLQASSSPTVSSIFATSTTATSSIVQLSSNIFSATTLCLVGDVCRTTWPTSGSSLGYTAWGGSVATTYSTSTIASTTPAWFKTALYASSTVANPSVIDNLTTTNGTTTTFAISGAFRATPAYIKFGPATPVNTSCQNATNGCFEAWGDDNTTNGYQFGVGNRNSGTSAYTGFFLNNDISDNTVTHFGFLGLNSSKYNDTTFGNIFAFPNDMYLQNTDGPLEMIVSTTTSGKNFFSVFIGGTASSSEILHVDSNGASTTALTVSNVKSALHLGGATGGVSAYGGTSCTNQFVRSLNGAGAASCNTVSLTADITGTLAYGNGGTGQTSFNTGNLVYAGASAFQSVATSSLGVTGPITFSGTIGAQVGGVGGNFGCTTASAGVTGCLSGTDWSTFNNKQSTVSATYPITFAANTIGFSGLGTTSPWINGQVAYVNSNNQLTSVATTSETCTSPLSCTAHAVLTGGGAITISQANATTNGYLGSTDWLTFNNKVATGTNFVSSNLAYFGSNGTLFNIATTTVGCSGNISCTSFNAFGAASTISFTGTLAYGNGGTGQTSYTTGNLLYAGASAFQNVATSAPTLSAAFNNSGTTGYFVGGTNGTISNVLEQSFTISSTTWGTGTTTIPLRQEILGSTFNGTRCKVYPSGATLDIQYGIYTASTTMIIASSTNNLNTFTSNNSISAGNGFYVDIGTAASSPTYINCTAKFTI